MEKKVYHRGVGQGIVEKKWKLRYNKCTNKLTYEGRAFAFGGQVVRVWRDVGEDGLLLEE